MIDFSKMPCVYWSNTTKISHLQRQVIVHSIMYYEYDESCISDSEYDSISRQLVELMNKSTKAELKASTYYYAMYNFDGNTGFDIASKLTKKDRDYLTCITSMAYDQFRYRKSLEERRRKLND